MNGAAALSPSAQPPHRISGVTAIGTQIGFCGSPTSNVGVPGRAILTARSSLGPKCARSVGTLIWECRGSASVLRRRTPVCLLRTRTA